MVDEPAVDDDVATVEERVAGDVGHADGGGVEHHVVRDVLEDERVRFHRGFDVDDRFENVVVNDHLLGSVFALLWSFGDDCCNRFTHEAHFVAGKQGAFGGWVVRGVLWLQAE